MHFSCTVRSSCETAPFFSPIVSDGEPIVYNVVYMYYRKNVFFIPYLCSRNHNEVVAGVFRLARGDELPFSINH